MKQNFCESRTEYYCKCALEDEKKCEFFQESDEYVGRCEFAACQYCENEKAQKHYESKKK